MTGSVADISEPNKREGIMVSLNPLGTPGRLDTLDILLSIPERTQPYIRALYREREREREGGEREGGERE